TLEVRVKTQSDSALQLARRLSDHPRVGNVLYPGLPAHPGHAIAARQMSGFGAMLSIRVIGGEPAAIATAAKVELWKRATSVGGARHRPCRARAQSALDQLAQARAADDVFGD